MAWTGGVDVFATHTGSVLAAATVDRLASPGTIFTWTVTGAAAQQMVDDWRAGNNSGLTLRTPGLAGFQLLGLHDHPLRGTSTFENLIQAHQQEPVIPTRTEIQEKFDQPCLKRP